ncbi:MAG: hypothetical protein LV481_16020 [Methylacidiphilales bacterium]|nr:hypothetical protein [Candidatus Methylacidiphilales bacterium]
MKTIKDFILFVAVPVTVALLMIALCGCGATIPPLVESSTASFDGKVQDSGVISLVPGGQLVTPHWRDRYNGMIAVYGKRFTPPVQTDDGILPAGPGNMATQYFIDNEHAVKFDQMNEWRKADAVKVTIAATPVSSAAPAKK